MTYKLNSFEIAPKYIDKKCTVKLGKPGKIFGFGPFCPVDIEISLTMRRRPHSVGLFTPEFSNRYAMTYYIRSSSFKSFL